MQKEDYKWYVEHLGELYKKYPNRYAVISNKKILNDFNSFKEAMYWAAENVGIGKFIIQKCTETLEVQYVYSPYVVLSDQEECTPCSSKTASIDIKIFHSNQ